MAYDEQLADRLRSLLDGEPGLSERKMFGGLAFSVDGSLAVTASSRGGLMVRVDPRDEDDLLADEHVEPMAMRGRAMTGWLHVDAAGLGRDDDLERWASIGVRRARSLPSS